MNESGIDKAVRLAGSQQQLATRVGITQQAIGEWVLQGFIPPGRIDDVLNAVDKGCVHIKPRDLLSPELITLMDKINGGGR